MATIYPSSQPMLAQQAAQAPVSSSSDPLFDALVKYITSGPGAQSATSAQVSEIIDSHTSVPGGRAYLESLVAPDPIFNPRIWKNKSDAHGFMSTNMTGLTLVFDATRAYTKGRGRADGFFPPQVVQFDTAEYYYDEPLENDYRASFEISVSQQWRQTVVYFYPEVYTPEMKRPIAELIMYNTVPVLPPQGAKGLCTLSPYMRTQ